MIAYLHLQHIFLYPRSPEQCNLWHPSNIVFILGFSIHPSNSFVKLLRAPITTGTNSTILSFHNLAISVFKSWCFSTSSLSFSPTLTSAGTITSMVIHFALSCQLKLCLVFWALSCCHTEHWYLTTLSLLYFLPGRVHTIFPCVLAHSSYKDPNGLSFYIVLPYLTFFLCQFSHPLTKCCILLPFFHIICKGGFQWFYQYGALNSLSWWPVSVQHYHYYNLFQFSLKNITTWKNYYN